VKKKRRKVEITKEVRVLIYLRNAAGLSLKSAARNLPISFSAISHIENGNMSLPYERIEHMVKAYGYDMKEFFKLIKGKEQPPCFKHQCQKLLWKVPPSRMEELHHYMQELTNGTIEPKQITKMKLVSSQS
jgi:transcriptional regulator with XRE-family HTH domain